MSRARDLANLGDGIDATQITSGQFDDNRIKATNVTQHEASIDALASNPTITLGSNTTFPTNSILQIKHYTRTTAFSDSVTSSFQNITSFEVSITPSSTSSKIFVLANFRASNGSSSNHNLLELCLRRDINNTGYSDIGNKLQSNIGDGYGYATTHVMSYIDSPSTELPIEYTVGYRDTSVPSGTIYIGTRHGGTTESVYESVITAMEIAG